VTVAVRYARPARGGSSSMANMASSATKPSNAPVAASTALQHTFNLLSAAHTDFCQDIGNKPAIDRSMAMLPAGARLQGACCSAMNLDHYIRQLNGLKNYDAVSQIPTDPYDIAPQDL